jgi:superfamily I DNA and/or RNA helicase
MVSYRSFALAHFISLAFACRKTSTIMGIVAVLLEVGVPSDSPLHQGKKIRVGSSLTGMAAKSIAAKTNQKPGNPSEAVSFAAEKTRILLCAPSNTAVDELVYRLKKYGVLGRDGRAKRSLSVVRIGQPLNSTRAASTSEGGFVDVKEFTLDYLVERKRSDIESTQRSGYRRPFMPSTLQLRHQVLLQADIVCCTLSGSGSPQLLEAIINHGASNHSSGGKSSDATSSGDGNSPVIPFRFDVVIIDEAAQAVEPSALIPLKYNPKVLIMVGDACQLRATVLSKDATKFNFGRSLFERFDLAGFPKQMLLTQYRMHPDIARFSSKRFYEGKLMNDSRMLPTRNSKGSHWKPFHDDRSRRLRPMVFHNVKYGREELSGSSYSNRAEVRHFFFFSADEFIATYFIEYISSSIYIAAACILLKGGIHSEPLQHPASPVSILLPRRRGYHHCLQCSEAPLEEIV